jgi:hypothetical protein
LPAGYQMVAVSALGSPVVLDVRVNVRSVTPMP